MSCNIVAAVNQRAYSGSVCPVTACRELEEKSDNMKQLENRTLDSKIELEIMDALDEIKAVNRRHETVDMADVLKASAARREKGLRGLVSGRAALCRHHCCSSTFSQHCCMRRCPRRNIRTGAPLHAP